MSSVVLSRYPCPKCKQTGTIQWIAWRYDIPDRLLTFICHDPKCPQGHYDVVERNGSL